jgi:hypothetical protein
MIRFFRTVVSEMQQSDGDSQDSSHAQTVNFSQFVPDEAASFSRAKVNARRTRFGFYSRLFRFGWFVIQHVAGWFAGQI